MRALELTGQRFGRLVAVKRLESDRRGAARWLCQCDCGGTSTPYTNNLRRGMSKSCGCLQAEKAKQGPTTHGQSGTPLHRKWEGMRQRCSREAHISYRYYGGKGIRVCDEWQTFEPFRDWSLENGYVEGLSIDRIDPDGDYEPGNCRYITMSENIARANRARAVAP